MLQIQKHLNQELESNLNLNSNNLVMSTTSFSHLTIYEFRNLKFQMNKSLFTLYN